ncbi:hypothetical protein [Staphylococcus aureus]|uniref:hypothetical protein n=1 Tax=Staphylococcus aureus TaxID=1280 RepID=UPI003309CF1E|nr:hypothetical protein [Staphylococcus aureus]HDE0518269.1 hypothetical protein [Staphylococcus aureus]HDE0678363.1 hypothetical protein [Staphylococcus aureus]
MENKFCYFTPICLKLLSAEEIDYINNTIDYSKLKPSIKLYNLKDVFLKKINNESNYLYSKITIEVYSENYIVNIKDSI